MWKALSERKNQKKDMELLRIKGSAAESWLWGKKEKKGEN